MVTCAGCPYGTFGQRTGIQRSSVIPVYMMMGTSLRATAALPWENAAVADVTLPYAAGAPSSSKKPRVLLGSTGMPGAMVVVKVIFFRYRPLAAAGLSLMTSSSAAE